MTDKIKQWVDIVNGVDKEHIPIDCINKVIFHLGNGSERRQKTVNIKRLRTQGLDIEEIDALLTEFIESHDEFINRIEYTIDAEAVAEIVQPETDKLLENI